MSERLDHKEHQANHEDLVTKEQLDALHHEKQQSAEKSQSHSAEKVAELERQAHEAAADKVEIPKDEPVKSELNYDRGHHAIKKDSYKSTLKRVQKELPAPARAFSKLIHQPSVEAVSEVVAKTAARPSAMLGAGLGSLLGSGVLLYYSYHYGFRYNYTNFLAMFLVGSVAGIVLEMCFRLIARRNK